MAGRVAIGSPVFKSLVQLDLAKRGSTPALWADALPPRHWLSVESRRANAQMIHICHTGLLNSPLPHMINHHDHLSCFMQLYKRVSAQAFARIVVLRFGPQLQGVHKILSAFLLLLLHPQLYLWGSPFWVRFLHVWPFLTIHPLR